MENDHPSKAAYDFSGTRETVQNRGFAEQSESPAESETVRTEAFFRKGTVIL
jgi:hypothetical protein